MIKVDEHVDCVSTVVMHMYEYHVACCCVYLNVIAKLTEYDKMKALANTTFKSCHSLKTCNIGL